MNAAAHTLPVFSALKSKSSFLNRFFSQQANMRTLRAAYLFIGLFFLALSGNASADWSQFSKDKEAVLYIDPEKIARADGEATAWVLKDFHGEQIGPSRERFRSAKIYYEFKCDKKLMRQAYLTRHFGAMGGAGSLSTDLKVYPWIAVVPKTEQARLFGLACQPAGPSIQSPN